MSNKQVQATQTTIRWLPLLLGVLFLCLSFVSQTTLAACPETVGTTSPIVYQDCVEFIDIDPGQNPDTYVATTSASTQIGDYQVLVVIRKSGSDTAAITTPTGWTEIMASTRNGADTNNDVVMGIYAKSATAAGSENVSVTTAVGGGGNTSNDLLITILRFSNTLGHDTAAGANAVNAPAANATVTSLGITTTMVNSMVLRVAGIDDDDQGNATDTTPLFGDTTVSLQETASSNNSATGIITRDLQADIAATGNATFANTGAEEWITRTFALRPQNYFSLTVPASGQICEQHVVSIVARNVDGTINTTYTGTITLSTSTALGDWSKTGGDANGDVTNGTANDGAATYNFTLADAGTIDLVYTSATVGAVNFNIVDGSGFRELKTVANDTNLTLAACVPTFLSIAHAGSGGMCGATAVTVSGVTAGLVLDPNYQGSIQISAGGSGNWSVAPGSPGTFDNGTADDGIATYDFVAGDGGDIVLFFTPGGAGTVNFNVVDPAKPLLLVHPTRDPDLTVENCEYRISHDSSGNNCSSESVTFAIVTASGAAVSNYVGTLNLTVTSAATDKGTWSLQGGDTGTLNETTIKDGIATYTFAASNSGSVTLNFATGDFGSFNFNVTGNSYLTNSSYDPSLTVAACKFRVVYTGGNSTDVCSYKEVTISAVDDNNVAVTNFVGQVSITTTSSKGTWQESGSQPGTLSDLLANDGAATYTFVAGDNGDVALILNVPEVGIGTLKVDVETAGGAIKVDTNPVYDPDLSIALCSYRIAVTDGQLSTCSIELVTLSVYTSSSALAVDYTGTVDLETLNGNGSWVLNTGTGTLQDPVAEDGDASYTFSEADNGVVVLRFLDETAEDTNIDATDRLEDGFAESGSYDPSLTVTPCIPTNFSTLCYNFNEALINNAISIPAEIVGLESRMVLMYAFTPSVTAPTAPTLYQGATPYAMTEIRTVMAGDALLTVWGILGTALPDTATTFNFNMGGSWNGPRDPGVCLVSLENVAQALPVATTPLQDGPINSFVGNATGSSALGLTSTQNNSVAISAIGTATDAATTIASSLGNTLWDLNSGDATAPDSSNFNGHYDIQPTAAAFTVTETTGTINDVAHIALLLAPRVAGAPFATDYVPVALFDTLAGNIGYRAIGNSLRAFANPAAAPYTNACVMNASSSAVLDLPTGSTIEVAYLYWGASGGTGTVLDTVVKFGATVADLQTLQDVSAEDTFEIMGVGQNGDLDYFVGYQDVTSLISTATSQSYSFTNLTAQTGTPWVTTSACVAGWGLVVVFENVTAEPFVNVINLFHGFQPFQNSSVTLLPGNFRMAQANALTNVPRGLITHITFEGDNTLNTGNEVFELQNTPAALTFEALTNPYNLGTAQYNDTVSFPNYSQIGLTSPVPYILQSGTSYGTDIDTYYIAGSVASAADSKEDILYPFAAVQAEQIATRFSAGQDLVLLTGEFISVTNAPIADLEIVASTSGTMKVATTAAGSVYFDIKNNGNNAPSNGYATGTVILSGLMPSGLTINAVDPADAHWACSNTTTAFRCTFDIESWTGGTLDGAIYRLDDGASLPQVEVVVDTGNETFFPLQSNTAYVSGRISHFDTPTGCSFVGIPDGEQPDPATCTKAEQFDNVNNLANNTIDIDSIATKQADNNNVDRATLTIAGVLTDLQMDISVPGVLQQGQTGQYQFAVTNNGPDATTKVMTVTATFDANAAPADGMFSVTGWSCNVASAALTCTSTAAIANGGSSNILVNIPNINKAEGQFVLVSAAVAAGTYNFDTTLSNNTDTLSTEVVGTIVPITEKFLLSVTEATTLGANDLGFGADDLVLFDPSNDEAELFKDMGTIGGVTDIDAVHLLSNGWIVFSADGAGTFLTVAYADEDLLIYDPILNSAVMLFDGSDANKFGAGAAAANIDALHVDTNGSWTTSSWELYLSTTDTASLPGTSNFEDKDMVLYDMAANTATLFFDGSDANKFGTGAGDIDGFFIPYDDADLYYLTVSDALASIDPPTSESFERDDLVSWDNAEANGERAQQVFDGEQSDGFTPLPISATLGLDALHVVQEGYFGHFAISTVDGDTCNAGSVTIRKHAALGHTVETTYRGSVRITESTGTGTWVADTTAKGTLVNLGSGVARYTFHPDDLGVVTLLLGNTNVSTNVDIDVTNGIAEEALAEDATIDIALSLLAVEYLDNFNLVSYGNNSGDTAWSSDWTEVNDDNSASAGDIFITGGRLRMKDSNADMPWVQRTVDFSYEAASDIVLTFKWNRTSGSPTDYFSVDYNLNSSGWTSLDQFGDASTGVVNQTSESINLTTAASITGEDGDSLQIRFRVASGMLLPYVEIDDIKISTSTGSDCNPGVPLDHYHVSHGGSMVSCVAENITITAHDSAHNAVNPGAGVVLELATFNAGGYWNQPLSGNGSLLPLTPASTGVATYTYPAGESAVTIPFNFTNIYPPTDSVQVNFSAASTVGAVEPDYVAPALTVNRAGLRFYNYTDSSTTMPSLMAGADSQTYSGKQLIVQLVQASPVNAAVCEPLVDVGEEASIQLVLECIDPGTCSATDLQASITHKDGTGTATSNINTLNDNSTTWISNEAEFGTAQTFEFEDFGGDPGAWFRINYPDVGDVQLHGRYRVPLRNDATAAAGLSADYLRGSASTNFRVRPFGLDVDFSDDRRTSTDDSLASTGATSDVFGVAGVAETVTVSAVIYQAADDVDGTPWQPDPTADLSDNAIARSFGSESWFDYKVKLNLMTDDPATGAEDPVVGSPQAAVPGGVVGVLSQTGAADDFTAGRSNFDLTYSEVGIIDIHAQLLNPNDSVASYGNSGGGFLGQVQGGILNVGRFVPFGFDLKLPGDSANTRVVERPDNGGAADFTYMGEEFEVYLALQAKQANGVDLTQNYRGDYANLDNLADGSAMFGFKAFEDIAAQADVNYTTRLGTLTDLAYTSAWQSGEAMLRSRLVFNRLASNVPDGPFTLSVGVDLADSDGVTDLADRRIDSGGADDTAANTLAFVDNNTFRHGRLVLLNAYGSELPNEGGLNEGKDLGMGMAVEYWDTATAQFVVNASDNGSVIGSDLLSEVAILEANPAADGGVLADGDVEALLNTSVADIKLAGGETRQTGTQDVPFWFTAPGETYEGRVLMELDLDAALLGFLKYDWRDAGQDEDIKTDPLVFGTQDNPRAVIEFGVYRGNSRIINWQELFINE